MKQALYALASLSFSTFLMAQVPQVVTSPVDHLFVPEGFDNNDNVEVIVTGKFPNPCYIKNKVDVEVEDNKVLINITALKKEGEGLAICEPLAVPYKEQITVGNLQGGDYEIIVNEKTEFEKKDTLHVNVSASSSVDEHLYPIVEYVELGFTGGLSGEAFLIAKSPSDCLAFDKVEYQSNKKDTISILPIMKKISSNCNEVKKRLQIPVKFNPHALNNKEVLLFVRSIEGKSVNTIITK